MVDAMDNSTAMPLSCLVVFSIELPELGSCIYIFIHGSVPPVSIFDQAVTPSCSRKWFHFHFLFLYYLEILFLLFSESCCLYYKPKKKLIRFAEPEIFLGFEVQIKRSYILTQQDENSDLKVDYFLSN